MIMNTHKLKPVLEFILLYKGADSDAALDAAWSIYDAEVRPASVLALISDNERLRADYVALAAFNPDWDKLAAAKDSINEHMAIIQGLKAENEALRANASLLSLLPELDEALEDLEIHGQHSNQGYRKLKDWYRKIDLACKAIDIAMSREASDE